MLQFWNECFYKKLNREKFRNQVELQIPFEKNQSF